MKINLKKYKEKPIEKKDIKRYQGSPEIINTFINNKKIYISKMVWSGLMLIFLYLLPHLFFGGLVVSPMLNFYLKKKTRFNTYIIRKNYIPVFGV